MNTNDLLALAERCEREDLNLRFLDWAIHDTILDQIGTGSYGNHPCYTTSLDAAVTLVPEGAEWSLTNLYGVAHSEVGLNFSDISWESGERPDGNLVLALCSAALKARAALAEQAEASKQRYEVNPQEVKP